MYNFSGVQVVYFNKKYSRVGHLFQGRFRSEAVEDDKYLLAVTRYVHNNPVEAKIVTNAHHFRWSSFNIYIDGEETNYLVREDKEERNRYRDGFKSQVKPQNP